jgi:hypothetical protein
MSTNLEHGIEMPSAKSVPHFNSQQLLLSFSRKQE